MYSTDISNKLNVYKSDIFNPPITLRVASRYYISKMLKSFFNYLINEHKITNEQVIGIILKANFIDGTERSISTFRKGSRKDSIKFSKLFKSLLNVRAEYYNSIHIKITQLSLNYTIYPLDYKSDDSIMPITNEDPLDKVKTKIDEKSEIKYMDPFKLVKIPLSYSGDMKFREEILQLNNNLSYDNNSNDKTKYRLNIKRINSMETEVTITLFEDNTIPIYRFKDKLISIASLSNKGILIERRIPGKNNEIYLIDMLTNSILLINKNNINLMKTGYINPKSLDEKFTKDPINELKKFITLDFETLTNITGNDDKTEKTIIDPILLTTYDFYNNNINSIQFQRINYPNFIAPYLEEITEMKYDNMVKIGDYLGQFMTHKFHKFRIYAHNMSGFDGIFILNSLLLLQESNNIKIIPTKRDNRMISIKVLFNYDGKYERYRNHIIFHDSYSLLLSSLDKLSKTFSKDSPELMKMDNREIIELLTSRRVRTSKLYNQDRINRFISDVQIYCNKDCLSLAYILISFGNLINEKWKINIHNYPTISSFRKGTRKDSIKFSKLFKHFLNLRAEYYNSIHIKITQLTFSYTIYPDNYNFDKDDLLFDMEMNDEDKDNIKYKELDNIKYMDPFKLIKLPLTYCGNNSFIEDFLKLNVNTSNQNILDDPNIKYKLITNTLNNLENEIKIVLQEDNSIPIYSFKDKLITIPMLNKQGILIERKISGKKEVYLIDIYTNEIIIINTKNINKNKMGYINPSSIDKNFIKDPQNELKKFITLDFETICNIDQLDTNPTKIDPILLSSYDFYNNELNSVKFEKPFYSEFNPLLAKEENEEITNSNLSLLSKYLTNFMSHKYHKFRIYAHNLSNFDGIFILYALYFLESYNNIKVIPTRRDNKLISIKVLFDYDGKYKRYRHYIIFHDSYSILLSPLDKLSKTFLYDSPHLMKLENKEIIETLISRKVRIKNIDNIVKFNSFVERLENYCSMDCISLAHIIYRFGILINEKWTINIHSYPTISSLAIAIYLTYYLKITDLIPLVTGKIYRDISKSYHGGHTDVYMMYSDKEVHSYDYTSMYPAMMLKHEMPVGKIDKFEGNPLNVGETFKSLCDKHAFVKCTVEVDKSLNRPVYMTKVKFNNENRVMCATGTFLNQWVYLKEICKYYELTNGKIRIDPNSIKKGYTFQSKNIFKDYITDLFKIKQSVTKDNPLYLISKILMNSLYGRFGLKQELTEHTLMSSSEIEEMLMSCEDINIEDIIPLDFINKSLVITNKDSDNVFLKSSIPIASAITAYARMERAEIILDESLDILYFDTDGFKSLQKITELPKYKHLDHNGLGGLKYEGTFSESIFLMPKVYGGVYKESGEEFTKLKGFKDKVEFEKFKDLLFKNSEITLTHNKWLRDWLKSEIKIMKSPYLFKINDNKRKLNLSNYSTNPYHFNKYNPDGYNSKPLLKYKYLKITINSTFFLIYFCINDFYEENTGGVAWLKFRSRIFLPNALVKSTIVLSVDFIVSSALLEAEFINLGRFGLKQELTEFNFMNT
jgi:DNA polymerase type B, organellar and viral